MESLRNIRVAIYSHDTFGLGHLTRSTRIATAVTAALPGASVLLLSGSPIAHRFHFPKGVDYVKLPSVIKAGPGDYVARELGLSARDIRDMRTRLIQTAVAELRPHLLLVDNVPCGMKGELLPTLQMLRRRHPDTRIHLNLRDILDEPAAIRAAWKEQDVWSILSEYYDAIHVFGSRDIFDAITAYDLPRAKTDYLGYIAPEANGPAPPLPPEPDAQGRSCVLVTTGGGGDGEEILRCVGRLQRHLGPLSPMHFHAVTGPLMREEIRSSLRNELAGTPGITLHEYIEQLPAWMARCDLVLSMGGYNTLCEVMRLAPRSLVVPRTYPRLEQAIRAQAFEDRGLLKMLHPDRLTVRNLERELREALMRPPGAKSAMRPPLDGAASFQRRLRGLFNGAGGPRLHTARGKRVSPAPIQVDIDPAPRCRAARPTSRPRRFPPPPPALGMFILAAVLLLGSAAGARGALGPERAAAELNYGYDSNLLDASDAERSAFDSRSPDALFVVDRMADSFAEVSGEGDWGLGRIRNVKTKLRLRAEYRRFLYAPIKSESAFAAELHGRPGGDWRVVLAGGYRPQVYGRHRRDKDAPPGDALYRADAHRRWDAEVAVRRGLGEHWTLETGTGLTRKDYRQAFDERDRWQAEIFVEAQWTAPGIRSWGLRGAYEEARSRNVPDLGKDLSYRQWTAAPQWRFFGLAGAFDAQLDLEIDWRLYSAQDPEDWNHWHRRDLRVEACWVLSHPLGSALTWQVGGKLRWRRANLDSDAVLDYDEEGSFSEQVVRSGITWNWEKTP